MFAAAFVFTNISFHQSLEIVAEGTQIYNLVSWNRQSRFSRVQIETLPAGGFTLRCRNEPMMARPSLRCHSPRALGSRSQSSSK